MFSGLRQLKLAGVSAFLGFALFSIEWKNVNVTELAKATKGRLLLK